MSEPAANPSLKELTSIINAAHKSNLASFIDGYEVHRRHHECSDIDLVLVADETYEVIVSVKETVEDGYLVLNEDGGIVHLTFSHAPATLPLQDVLARIQPNLIAK